MKVRISKFYEDTIEGLKNVIGEVVETKNFAAELKKAVINISSHLTTCAIAVTPLMQIFLFCFDYETWSRYHTTVAENGWKSVRVFSSPVEQFINVIRVVIK